MPVTAVHFELAGLPVLFSLRRPAHLSKQLLHANVAWAYLVASTAKQLVVPQAIKCMLADPADHLQRA